MQRLGCSAAESISSCCPWQSFGPLRPAVTLCQSTVWRSRGSERSVNTVGSRQSWTVPSPHPQASWPKSSSWEEDCVVSLRVQTLGEGAGGVAPPSWPPPSVLSVLSVGS